MITVCPNGDLRIRNEIFVNEKGSRPQVTDLNKYGAEVNGFSSGRNNPFFDQFLTESYKGGDKIPSSIFFLIA